MVIFHSYVSLPEGNTNKNHCETVKSFISDELRVAELGGASGCPLARAKAATFAWSWKSLGCGFFSTS
jgi:hypothetical protein